MCERIDSLDIIDECVNDIVHECVGQDPLAICLSQGPDKKSSNMDVVAYVRMLESTPYAFPYKHQRYKPLRKEDDPKPSLPSKTPNLELKPLPSSKVRISWF